jgi:hypothetical protein
MSVVPEPGQVVTVFRNRLRPDARARQPEHREAQRAGVRDYYEEYSISVGVVDRVSHWSSTDRPDDE